MFTVIGQSIIEQVGQSLVSPEQLWTRRNQALAAMQNPEGLGAEGMQALTVSALQAAESEVVLE
jgi:hypothetical protein